MNALESAISRFEKIGQRKVSKRYRMRNTRQELENLLATASANLAKPSPQKQPPHIVEEARKIQGEYDKAQAAETLAQKMGGKLVTPDRFTGEMLAGPKYPTRTGGYYITQDNPSESYYLLFAEGKTFILPAIEGVGKPMRVLYRPGKGVAMQAEMDAIIKSKPTLAQLKQYYKIIAVTRTQRTLDASPDEVWSLSGGMTTNPWIAGDAVIYFHEPFRLDPSSATIVW
jgi:hypothetical protein